MTPLRAKGSHLRRKVKPLKPSGWLVFTLNRKSETRVFRVRWCDVWISIHSTKGEHIKIRDTDHLGACFLGSCFLFGGVGLRTGRVASWLTSGPGGAGRSKLRGSRGGVQRAGGVGQRAGDAGEHAETRPNGASQK